MAGEAIILEEDNDRGHGSEGSGTNYIKEARKAIDAYFNVANSPDLSPIENVWRVLKQRLKQRRYKNLADLKDAMIQEWDKISQKLINRYIDSMPRRIFNMMCNSGQMTQW